MANGQDKYVPSWVTGTQDTTAYTPSWTNQQTQDKETVINEMPTFTEALKNSFAEEVTFGFYNDPSLDASELSSSASMGKAIGSTIGFFGISIAASIATGGFGTLALMGARADKLRKVAGAYNKARKSKDVQGMAKAVSESGLGVRGSVINKLNSNNMQKGAIDKFMKLAEKDVSAARRYAIGREMGKDAALFGFTGQLMQEDDASFKQRAVSFGQDAVAGALFSAAPVFKFKTAIAKNPAMKALYSSGASRKTAELGAYFTSGFISSQPDPEQDNIGNRALTGLVTLGMGGLFGGGTLQGSKSDMKRALTRIGLTDEKQIEDYAQIAAGVVKKEAGDVLTKQYSGIEFASYDNKGKKTGLFGNVKRIFLNEDNVLSVEYDTLYKNKNVKDSGVVSTFHDFHMKYKRGDTDILRQIKNNHDEAGNAFSFFKNQTALTNFLNREKYGILTANEPIFQSAAKVPLYGETRNDILIRELLGRGYSRKNIMKVEGTYDGIPDGNSFIVKGLKEKDAIELASLFGQESVATNKGLLTVARPKKGAAMLYERDPITDDILRDKSGKPIPKGRGEEGYRSGVEQFQIDDISYAPRKKTIIYGNKAKDQYAYTELTSTDNKPLIFSLDFDFKKANQVSSKFKLGKVTEAAQRAGDIFVIQQFKGDRKQIYRALKEAEQNIGIANSNNTLNTHRLLKRSLFNKNSLKEMTDNEIQQYGALLKEDDNFMLKAIKEAPTFDAEQMPEISYLQKAMNFILPSSSKFEYLGKKFKVPALTKLADDMKEYRRYNEEIKSSWLIAKNNIQKTLDGFQNDIDQEKVLRNLQFSIEKGKFGSLIEDMTNTEIKALADITQIHNKYMDDMYDLASKAGVKQKKLFINKKSGKVDIASEPLEKRKDFVSLTVTDEAQEYFSSSRNQEVRDEFIDRIINRNPDFIKKGQYANLSMNEKRKIANTLLDESLEQSQRKGIFGAQYARLVDLDAKLFFDEDGSLIRGVKDMKLKAGDSFEGIKIGKVVDIYEMDYTANMDRYASRIANITSASKYFGSDGLKIQGDTFAENFSSRLKEIKQFSSSKNYQYFKDELEKDMEIILYGDGYNDIVAPISRFGVSWTASLGLSSPVSALKNFGLGTVQTTTTFGEKAVVKTLYKVLNDPLYREEMFDVTRQAGTFTGGERFLETQKVGAVKWSRKIQRGLTYGMKKTEEVNRTFSAMVGHTAADDALRALRGDTSGVMVKMQKAEARRILEDVLEVKDIDKAIKRGSFDDNQMKQIFFQSHYITQGLADATSVPRFMNKAYFKPFTLFYRIAFRVTENVYKNAYKPIIDNGNPAPMMRYVAATTAGGAGLQYLYHQAYNTEPEKFAKAPEVFWNNFVQGEGLGVLSAVANTTGRGFEGMSPAIIQTGLRLGGGILQIAEGAYKTTDANTREAGKLLAKDGLKRLASVPAAANLVIKSVEGNITKETYKDYENFNRMRAEYQRDILNKYSTGSTSAAEEKTLFHRLMKANVYSDRDMDRKVKDFYAAVGYFQHQFEMDNTYRTNPKLAQAKAFDKVLKYIKNDARPVNLGRTPSLGKTISDYDDFVSRLNPEEKKKLKELETIHLRNTQELLQAVVKQRNFYLK